MSEFIFLVSEITHSTFISIKRKKNLKKFFTNSKILHSTNNGLKTLLIFEKYTLHINLLKRKKKSFLFSKTPHSTNEECPSLLAPRLQQKEWKKLDIRLEM